MKELHSKLRLAWLQYVSCWAQVLLLTDKNNKSYKRVSAQYEEQAAKKQTYDATVDQYMANSLTNLNAQVIEDVVK